jgi:hypothetical protein
MLSRSDRSRSRSICERITLRSPNRRCRTDWSSTTESRSGLSRLRTRWRASRASTRRQVSLGVPDRSAPGIRWLSRARSPRSGAARARSGLPTERGPRFGLQADQRGVIGRKRRWEVLPPALARRLLREREEFVRVTALDVVQVQQLPDLGIAGGGMRILDPGELGRRPAHSVGDLIAGQPGTLAQPTQLSGEPTPMDGRTGRLKQQPTFPEQNPLEFPESREVDLAHQPPLFSADGRLSGPSAFPSL